MRRTRNKTPMDKAAAGLMLAGEALAAMYSATSQVLPAALERTDKVLALAERGVLALEQIAREHHDDE